MNIYTLSATQISIQEPLNETWFESAKTYSQPHIRAIEPDFKDYINPITARRMSPIIKRAIATSKRALAAADINMPDAIICGTGLGCVENTEKFLNALTFNGEQLLQPTHFIQSTHNTIASQIALMLECHGYNNTYVHRGISFESALLDAAIQLQLGEAKTVLVGGHDELTPGYFELLKKIGYWRKNVSDTLTICNRREAGTFCGEGSTMLLLGTIPNNNTLAQLNAIEVLYQPTLEIIGEKIHTMLSDSGLSITDLDAVFMGVNGDIENDEVYDHITANFFAGKPVCAYKNVCGEYFTAPAFGTYAAAQCIKHNNIPATMFTTNKKPSKCNHILLINHFQNKDYSLILLSKC